MVEARDMPVPVMGLFVVVVLALAIKAGLARDWLDSPVVSAAEQMLAAMPDDYFAIKPADANQEIAEGQALVIDVREPAEFATEHIAAARSIPLRQLAKMIDTLPDRRAAPIVVYCRSGYRGAVALTILRMAGYTNVRNVIGGFEGWKAVGLPAGR